MISNILLIISLIIVLYCYLKFLILYILNKKNKTKYISSSLVIDNLNDNNINLIENKKSLFSKYNIKRKVIKLSKNTYDSSNIFTNSISLFLVGYSNNGNNPYIHLLNYIFKEIKPISFSAIISLVCCSLANNIADAKIALFIIIILAIYQYILNNLNCISIQSVKINDTKINYMISKINNINTWLFITTLIEILRLAIIIINIK